MPFLSWVVSNVVLALVLALAAWAAWRLSRPGVAHALWVLVLVKLVTPPLVVVPLGSPSGAAACSLGTCACDHSREPVFARDSLPWILLGVWAVGAGATACVAWHRWRQFRRLTAHAAPAPAEWQSLSARLASELCLRHPPEVFAVPGRLPPLVLCGRTRPRLLLPADLLGQLNASQREALLLHELIHLKRGDHRVRLLEVAVRVAYWWLPVGWVGRHLRACEEVCCDAAVVSHLPDARREYAGLLLDVIDFADAVPQATAMSAADGLEQRLRAILHAPARSPRPLLAWACAAAVAAAVLPFGMHYELAARPIPVGTPATDEPDAGDACSPAETRRVEWSKVACCPS